MKFDQNQIAKIVAAGATIIGFVVPSLSFPPEVQAQVVQGISSVVALIALVYNFVIHKPK